MMGLQKLSPLLLATFGFCAVFVMLSLIPAIYPALYASLVTTNKLEDVGIGGVVVNYAELGVLAAPVIAANLIVLVLGMLYWRGHLPKKISDVIKSVFSFEMSKKATIIVFVAILATYSTIAASDLAREETWADYAAIKERAGSWSYGSMSGWDIHVVYFLLSVSLKIFGNINVLPFIASLGLLSTVFFMTKKIARKRFAGLVAMALVLQSNVFLTYSTSATYSTFWVLFYLLSLYLVYRAWPLAHASFVLSIPSKALSAAFFPMSLYFMLRSDMPAKKKSLVVGTYTGMLAVVAAAVSSVYSVGGIATATEFSAAQFWSAFAAFAMSARLDLILVMFLLPLTVGLFFVARAGSRHAESILFTIGWLLLVSPLVDGFTNQTNQPYRFLPLVVFFAIGVGVLFKPKET